MSGLAQCIANGKAEYVTTESKLFTILLIICTSLNPIRNHVNISLLQYISQTTLIIATAVHIFCEFVAVTVDEDWLSCSIIANGSFNYSLFVFL